MQRGKTGVLRVVQEQHYGVELLPGPIVSAQGDDEVVEAVPRRLRRHDDQLVLKAVGLGILEAAVRAALRGWKRWQPGVQRHFTEDCFCVCVWIHLIEAKAAEGSLLWQEVAESGRAADVGRVGRVALHETAETQQGGGKVEKKLEAPNKRRNQR